ncbi:MAG: ferritin-like domain-containing protein [Cyanobacteria bacterium J069]
MNGRKSRLMGRAVRTQGLSRRQMLTGGAAIGAVGALSVPLLAGRADASTESDRRNDVEILNTALFYEHAAIWAYSAAAGQLTTSNVGNAVKAIALANQADHVQHRDTLISVIRSLNGTPVGAEASYDLSPYLERGEGNLDSDVNIAKLALALETDAAIAYSQEIARLKTPALITAGASIGSTEASHATLIRAAFQSLGVDIQPVPAAFVSAETRDVWVLTV